MKKWIIDSMRCEFLIILSQRSFYPTASTTKIRTASNVERNKQTDLA